MSPPFSLLYNNPLAISDDGLAQVVDALHRFRGEFDPAVLAAAKAQRAAQIRALDGAAPLVEGRAGYVIDGVAVIPIVGPLVRHASIFDDVSALSSYESIACLLDAADARADVREIVLRCDSPGGEAMGCRATAERIRAAAGKRPVTAHIDGFGASGCWWLACGASRIEADPSALVGSIGVRIVVVDDSVAQEKLGVRAIEIINSDSPGKRATPIDDEVKARLKARANDIATVFIDDVARYRGVSVADVVEKYGGGDVIIATKARAVGMVDALASFDSVLASARARNNSPSRTYYMSVQTESAPVTVTDAAAAVVETSPAATVEAPAVRVEDAPATAPAPEPPAPPAPAPTVDMGDGACTGCSKAMSDADPIYCAGCAGKESAALVSTSASLTALVESIGAKTANEAIGIVAALRQEAASARELRAQLDALHGAARTERFSAQLGAAVAAARINVGELTAAIPAFLDAGNRDKAKASIAALTDGASANGAKVAAAIAGAVTLSEGEAERLGAYLGAKAPAALPAPAAEPERAAADESHGIEADAVAAFAARARETFDRSTTSHKARA